MQQMEWHGRKLIKITNKYNGICHECEQSIYEGDQIYFDPKGSLTYKVFCLFCGDQIQELTAKVNVNCGKCKVLILVGEQCFYDYQGVNPKQKVICSDCNQSAKRKSVADLSTPMTGCGSDLCDNLTPTNIFLCKSCNKKLPLVLKNELQLAYNNKLRNKNDKTIKELASKFRECLPYLE